MGCKLKGKIIAIFLECWHTYLMCMGCKQVLWVRVQPKEFPMQEYQQDPLHWNERRQRITIQHCTSLMLVHVCIKGISFIRKVFSAYAFRNERIATVNSGKGFFLWSVNQETWVMNKKDLYPRISSAVLQLRCKTCGFQQMSEPATSDFG